jgi:hypothetical protein
MCKKKLFILFLALLFLKTSFSQQACTPDPQYNNTAADAGIHPNCTTNFDTAYVNTPYLQLITVVIPPDTQVFPSPFPPLPWDSTRLDSVGGLPASMTLACLNNNGSGNSSRCMWKGNSIGCAIITGTPTPAEIGSHNLTFYTSNYLGGQTSPNPYAITCYKIVVMPASNVNEAPKIYMVMQNTPNPFAEKSEITFTSENSGMITVRIYNMVGMVIKEYNMWAKKGINKVEIDAREYNSGIYFYSLSNGNNVFTRKMIIKK